MRIITLTLILTFSLLELARADDLFAKEVIKIQEEFLSAITSTNR